MVEILKLGLVKILKLKFYGEADDWLRFWNWCLFEILKMTFDQDLLCWNLWYELNPRVRCAFGNVLKVIWSIIHEYLNYTTMQYLTSYRKTCNCCKQSWSWNVGSLFSSQKGSLKISSLWRSEGIWTIWRLRKYLVIIIKDFISSNTMLSLSQTGPLVF